MNGTQPPRRRRIAGESAPTVPTTPGTPKGPRLPKLGKPSRPPKIDAPKVDAPKPEALVAKPPASEAVRRNTPSPARLALVAFAMAAVAFAAVAVPVGIHQWRSNSAADAREAANSAAASAAETIFSFRYDKLPEHLRDSQATMTLGFADKFKKISPVLDLAKQRKMQVKAVVRYSAAVECGDRCSADKATILVFIDKVRAADDNPEPKVFVDRIEMSMVKRHEKWLVNNIKAL